MSGSISKVFEKVIKKYGMETQIRQNEALFIWEKVVGENIARHTKPEKVSFGKLFIKVDSPVWRNELMFQKKDILNKINSLIKNANIFEIVLR